MTLGGKFTGGELTVIRADCVRDHITATPRQSLQTESEFIFINILFSDERVITLGVLYRPPNEETKPLEDLQTALQVIGLRNDLILVGDFNLSAVDWRNTCAKKFSKLHSAVAHCSGQFLDPVSRYPCARGEYFGLSLGIES